MSFLYISTEKNANKNDIAIMMSENNIECQIYDNVSTVKNVDTCLCEIGFKILFLNLDKNDFKEPLSTKYNLKCAHIEYHNTFKGCIMNWPGVFTEDHCSMAETNK